MRRRAKIIVVLAILTVAGFWVFFPSNKAKGEAKRMREALRREGFKTELSDFNFSLPADVQARADALTRAGQTPWAVFPSRGRMLFAPVGSNAAIVLARQETFVPVGDSPGSFPEERATDRWPMFRSALDNQKAALDAACEAAISGPIRFQPDTTTAVFTMAYVPQIRSLAGALAARNILELHDGHRDQAWTNLLALTRLATAWDSEPVEMGYSTKFYCATMAMRAAWESVEMHALDHAKLAALAKEWEAFEPFKGLPEATELSCASFLRHCELVRERPPASGGNWRALGDMIESPGRGWKQMTSGWKESRYRNYGVYEDEVAAMAYYREREQGLRKMTNGTVWANLRLIPGVTNLPAWQGDPLAGGRVRNSGSVIARAAGAFGQQRGIVDRAAEAEARRRLVCAALALENYYQAHGSYPASLGDLAPGFVPPVDFMDGKPLRYRRFGEGNFLLYSTGLDCVDDGGRMNTEPSPRGSGRGFFRFEEPDLLWPRAASPEELAEEQKKQE